MAYEVLARKWRPDRFETMVGQEHVLRALIHALEADRLHHAYLFTGTRGVGKTTVARILARCLNCEQGVSPTPCGVCGSCTEIAEGRFVDLIEVDAASRTRVEDTRELLDNVQYAPTRGRFKVYLIDEVHMLSTSSFNALLKTLEEPPPHVKFLLATTDPKKLPVTVLSRCLQFHLKNLTPDRIAGHLADVLGQEQIEAEPAALEALARAADGSMRDALSLTDQAIAHGGGALRADDVARMLGTIDQDALSRILAALAAGDGEALFACSDDLAMHAADFASVLASLMSALHEVALLQALGSNARSHEHATIAGIVPPEDVQLWYQIAVTGVRDLPWAPDPKTGFEMTLLRMLAFRPQEPPPAGLGGGDATSTGAAPGAQASSAPVAPSAARALAALDDETTRAPARARAPEAPTAVTSAPPTPTEPEQGVRPTTRVSSEPSAEPFAERSEEPVPDVPTPDGNSVPRSEAAGPATESAERDAPMVERTAEPVRERAPGEARPAGAAVTAPGPSQAEERGAAEDPAPAFETPEDWPAVFAALRLRGMSREFASHCVPARVGLDQLELLLAPSAESLLHDVHVERIREALAERYGRSWQVNVRVEAAGLQTPAERAAQERARRQAQAEASIDGDDVLHRFAELFDASVQRESIRPRP